MKDVFNVQFSEAMMMMPPHQVSFFGPTLCLFYINNQSKKIFRSLNIYTDGITVYGYIPKNLDAQSLVVDL